MFYAILFGRCHYSHSILRIVVRQQNKLNGNLSGKRKLWRLAAAILFDSKEQIVSLVLEIFVGSEGVEIVFLVHRLENAFIRDFGLVEGEQRK